MSTKKYYIKPAFQLIALEEDEPILAFSRIRVKSASDNGGSSNSLNNTPGLGEDNAEAASKGFSWDAWGDDEDF